MVDREGMYRRDGVIYKVQRAVHGSGNLYAKELTDSGFVYAQGMVYKLKASDMMTLEEAKEYGALYGICCVCGAELTDEKSIEAGIGPVCAKKGGFATAAHVQLYQDDLPPVRSNPELGTGDFDDYPAESSKPARVISTGQNQYGPVFQLRWDYHDEDFLVIKEAVRGFDWKVMHQKWNPDEKCWSVSATPNAVPVLLGFAGRFNFVLDEGAQATVRNERPDFEPEMMVVQADSKPVARSFRELAALA